MALRYDGGDLIKNHDGSDYRATVRFQNVLSTLPDSSVPNALVLVGLLTEDLTPVTGELSQHQNIAAETTDPPKAHVPAETVERILWLLSEVGESLNADRKRTIGTILSNSGLNSPATDDVGRSKIDPEDGSDSDHPEQSRTDRVDRSDTETDQSQSQGNYGCEFCAERFRLERQLMSHLIECPEKPDGVQFSCDRCNRTYHSQYALDRHVERSHEEKPTQETLHRCSDCGATFESAMDLLKHKPDHTESNVGSTTEDSRTSETVEDSSEEYTVRQDLGVVTHYNADDGYGFISTSTVSDDVFFHVNDVRGRAPTEDDLLMYDIRETDRGYNAVNITHKQRTEPVDDPFSSTRTRWGR